MIGIFFDFYSQDIILKAAICQGFFWKFSRLSEWGAGSRHTGTVGWGHRRNAAPIQLGAVSGCAGDSSSATSAHTPIHIQQTNPSSPREHGFLGNTGLGVKPALKSMGRLFN
ncbi:MAG: hypothetical protein MUC60_18740 [Oscillatoria sp. Prado101]|nr:hypothetical protein [Oscillatoria sp. Prado101]